MGRESGWTQAEARGLSSLLVRIELGDQRKNGRSLRLAALRQRSHDGAAHRRLAFETPRSDQPRDRVFQRTPREGQRSVTSQHRIGAGQHSPEPRLGARLFARSQGHDRQGENGSPASAQSASCSVEMARAASLDMSAMASAARVVSVAFDQETFGASASAIGPQEQHRTRRRSHDDWSARGHQIA